MPSSPSSAAQPSAIPTSASPDSLVSSPGAISVQLYFVWACTLLPVVRQSARVTIPFIRLHGYDVDIPSRPFNDHKPQASQVVYPLEQHMHNRRHSPTHPTFVVAVSIVDEPKYFYQVVRIAHWLNAMQSEITTQEANGT
ncbi:unnamed protein product [Linum trigynum]|uniref:Hexosyltransferase n=1 Tax=Linum trigynum TaxID=586398 RepID=A0AAV2CN74_9ROSI